MKAPTINDTFATHAMTGKKTANAITGIAKTASTIGDRIHAVQVAILLQSLPHAEGGHLDASKALPLAQALGKSLPRNKIVGWFHDFTNIRITVTTKEGQSTWAMKLLGPKDNGYRELTSADVKEAIAKPYWANMPEPDLRPLDAQAQVKALLNRLKTARSGEEGRSVKDVEAADKAIKTLSALIG